jgi:hypothetical protein
MHSDNLHESIPGLNNKQRSPSMLNEQSGTHKSVARGRVDINAIQQMQDQQSQLQAAGGGDMASL